MGPKLTRGRFAAKKSWRPHLIWERDYGSSDWLGMSGLPIGFCGDIGGFIYWALKGGTGSGARRLSRYTFGGFISLAGHGGTADIYVAYTGL